MTYLHELFSQLRAFFSRKFYSKLLIALICLVLYGVTPDGFLLLLLVLFVVLKTFQLLHEGLFKTTPDWSSNYQELLDYLRELSPQRLADQRLKLGLPTHSSATQITDALLEKIKSETPNPRSWNEISSEFFGLVSLALLLPVNIDLYTQEFVSPMAGYSYLASGIVFVCIGFYWLPKVYFSSAKARMFYWSTPLLPALFFAGYGASVKHPYLNPFNPNQNRLKAEKIISLQDNVEAASHWYWLYDYAIQAQQQGHINEAVEVYRYIQTLVPNNPQVRQQLALIHADQGITGTDAQENNQARNRAFSPLWTEGQLPEPLSECSINETLQLLNQTTIVIVPVGSIPRETINITGQVLLNELGIPVCISKKSLQLPEYDRFRGLVFGKQWHVDSLIKAFQESFNLSPPNPALYLILTDQDIYINNSNFVFSQNNPWGAILSSRRFDEGDRLLMLQRTAKQALGTLSKVLGAHPSPDRYCVTSYTASLEEFDTKGNRPNLQTLAVIRSFLEKRDREWRQMKAVKL